MPKISTDNYDTVASWNGSQDLFVVEQPDGTKVATPAMVKQYMEAGDFVATGEITDGHGNILKDMAKSADVDAEIGDLSQTGLAGDSVAEQLDTAREQISGLKTPVRLWYNANPTVDETYNLSEAYTNFSYVLIVGQTSRDIKTLLIPTAIISASITIIDSVGAGAWNSTNNRFAFNGAYGLTFPTTTSVKIVNISNNDQYWIFKPTSIYGIG